MSPRWEFLYDFPEEYGDIANLKAQWNPKVAATLWSTPSVLTFLNLVQTYSSDEKLFILAVWASRVYAQCMWVGPELTSDDRAALPRAFFDEEALMTLMCEGEIMESLVDIPGALLISRRLLSKCVSLPQKWWRARSSLMHHRSLAGGIQLCDCKSLKEEVLQNYQVVAQLVGILPAHLNFFQLETTIPQIGRAIDSSPVIGPRDDAAPARVPEDSAEDYADTPSDLPRDYLKLMQLEILSNVALYGFGNAFREFLEQQSPAWDYVVEWTGRQGIRRVHQTESTAQLAVILRKKDPSERTRPKALSPPLTERAIQTPFPRPCEVPRDITLSDMDATNDILARPKYTDASEADGTGRSMIEKFYLLALANEKLAAGKVEDDVAMNVIGCLTGEILQTADAATNLGEALTEMQADADWCLWANALYTRSRAEFNRTKTKERSCLQILSLEELGGRSVPLVGARLRYLWLSQYPNKWELRREVGKKFRDMGAPLTARDMYVKMEMWNDVIECLVSVNRLNEACDIVNTQLKLKPDSPALLYLKGQVSPADAEENYLKAWTNSRGRYYKATNALAYLYLKEANNPSADQQRTKAQLVDLALTYFDLTIRLKPHLVNTQFTFGCLLMENNRLVEALSAFNTCLLHEGSDNYQVWANMGAIHYRSKSWPSALKCFQQAARLAQNKWRIWDSYTKVCFVMRDYLGALEGLTKMLDLDATQEIQTWMLEKLVEQVAENSGTADVNIAQTEFKNRVRAFFEKYFLKLDYPLPSRQSGAIEPSVPILDALKRYQPWLAMLDLTGPPEASLAAAITFFREVVRLLEDCFGYECPEPLRDGSTTYCEFIEKLLDQWSGSARKIYSYLAVLRENMQSATEYEEKRVECTRLIDHAAKRLKIQLDGCSLLSKEDRHSLLEHIDF